MGAVGERQVNINTINRMTQFTLEVKKLAKQKKEKVRISNMSLTKRLKIVKTTEEDEMSKYKDKRTKGKQLGKIHRRNGDRDIWKSEKNI